MSAGTDLAKLTPPLLDRTLRRPRVEACIASALAEGGCCWLAAPAGYGKTTAAVDFIRDQATPAVWCRIDEGDQDIASFLHYLTLLVPASRRAGQATFGPEHAEHPQAFARRFFRGWFAALPAGAVVVLDDLHDADTPTFHVLLKLLLEERPGSVRCMFLSRTFPPRELDRLRLAGQVRLLDQDVLQFTEAEARALMDERRPDGGGKLPVDLARAP